MELKREISIWGILFASISAIIGSGWLFGSLYAAQMAGPAAIFSWIIGGVVVIFLAFCFAELATMFPVAGAIGVFSLHSHGKSVSFLVSFLAWVAFVIISPIEVQAVIQYSANYLPELIQQTGTAPKLSMFGFFVAFLLLLLLALVNAKSVKFMSQTNFLVTIWKIFIPVLAVILFLASPKHMENLTKFGGFAPYGATGVFSSLAVGGIILAFNGFQPGIALAGETKNPQKTIPIAIIGSVVICTIIYVMLQISFLLAVPSQYLNNGWQNLSFSGEAGPLAGLASLLGLGILAKLLYTDALISPMGTGLVFFGASARSSYAMAKEKFLPQFFETLTKSGIPFYGVLANLILSLIVFVTFSGWQEMAAFYAAAICLCNSTIPVALAVLRRKSPDFKRPFKIKYVHPFCFSVFYMSNLTFFWCGWNIIWKLDLVIIIGLLIYKITTIFQNNFRFLSIYKIFDRNLIFYLLFILSLSILSKLSEYGQGSGVIHGAVEFIYIGILSVIFYVLLQWINVQKKNEEY